MASIAFHGVSFSYTKSRLMFRNLSLKLDGSANLDRGHIIAIMGPSGTGKTTLLRLICEVEVPVCGSVVLSPPDASVSYLQQQPVLFEHLSRTANARYFENVRHTRDRFDEVVFGRLVTKLKLAAVLDSTRGIDELSGGERQRLSLLRAISIRPRILLLDEPCTGLDTDVKLEFLHMLREVVDELGLLAVYVTHHSDEAELVADELLYLSKEKDTGSVNTTLLPIQQALEFPPSAEAALGAMGPGGNRVSCVVEAGGIILSQYGTILGRALGSPIESGACLLVFPAETVRWGMIEGRGVKQVGRSSRYSFATAPETDKLIGPICEFDPTSFALFGPAVLFGPSGGSGIRVTITA